METPLLTAIALSDCWSAGWLLLRSASDWQPPAEITDELCGKYGWLGRRAAMRRIAGELSGNADPNLRRAAKLLAADPADAEACREIAEMLTEELYRHNLTDAAADAIKGWGALARGLGDAAEPDPIKAARLAYEATLGRRPAVQDAPSPEESAPVLDDWELIEFPGHRAVRGMISGSVKYEAGQIITTSAVRKNDLDMTWVRTRNSIYRLGYRLSDRAPIIRAVLKRTRNDAYNLTYGITGAYTLSKEVRDSAPAGVRRRLAEVELAARDLESFSTTDPSIAKAVQLPDWGDSAKMAWPPPRPFVTAWFAPAAVDRRYSAEWWKGAEEEARALCERQKREAAEQEAKALENYHGPRWWERAPTVGGG